MIRISNDSWMVGDAPVPISTYFLGTYWEEVISLYNKKVGKTTGMVGIFTLDRATNTIKARCISQETFNYGIQYDKL